MKNTLSTLQRRHRREIFVLIILLLFILGWFGVFSRPITIIALGITIIIVASKTAIYSTSRTNRAVATLLLLPISLSAAYLLVQALLFGADSKQHRARKVQAAMTEFQRDTDCEPISTSVVDSDFKSGRTTIRGCGQTRSYCMKSDFPESDGELLYFAEGCR